MKHCPSDPTKMNQTYLNIKDESEMLQAYEKVISLDTKLDEVIREISTLERGKVKSKDTLRRSKVGSYVSELLQQIGNFVVKNNITLSKDLSTKVLSVREKAEKILRENITLQTKSPLDVVHFSDVPVRYTYSTFGGREQRWGYGLHMNPFNEEGKSITIAEMPPHYVQSIHNHSLSEYCLIIGSNTEGVYYPGKKREKIYSTKKSEIFRFSPTTPHTLRNASNKSTRNMTFKDPKALFDWKPASDLHSKKIVRARIIKGKFTVINPQITKKVYTIEDQYYNYKIVITKLEEGTKISDTKSKDHFIFVIRGKFEITHKNITKSCRKNDYIVIDKGTNYTIHAQTMCRIYEIDMK